MIPTSTYTNAPAPSGKKKRSKKRTTAYRNPRGHDDTSDAPSAATVVRFRLPHENVDERVLHERGEDEHGAGGHEDVDGLDVGHRGQRLLRLGVLRGQREQARHAQSHPGRHSLGFDPERDPRHDHDQTGRDVRVEHVVAQTSLQGKGHLNAREVTCTT